MRDRNGNISRTGMLGFLDQPRTGMTPTVVPNAVFVGPSTASPTVAGGSTGSFPTTAVVVGVLAIGGYFLYKKMRK